MSESPARLQALAASARDFFVATGEESAGDPYDFLVNFLADARRALEMDIAFVARFADDQRVFKIVSASAAHPEGVVVGASDPLVDSYCKLVVEGRLPRAIADASELPLAAAMAITKRLDIRAYLSVPIVLPDGSVYGTLCCFSHLPRPTLSSMDADALQAVADVIAAALYRDAKLRDRVG